MPTREEVLETLHQVEDPELGMDIVDLGLLYDVEVEGPKVKVSYTLTSMGCPAGAMIQEDIDRVVRSSRRRGRRVRAHIEPPWSEQDVEDAKFILGFWATTRRAPETRPRPRLRPPGVMKPRARRSRPMRQAVDQQSADQTR